MGLRVLVELSGLLFATAAAERADLLSITIVVVVEVPFWLSGIRAAKPP